MELPWKHHKTASVAFFSVTGNVNKLIKTYYKVRCEIISELCDMHVILSYLQDETLVVLTTEMHYSGSTPFQGHTERLHSGWTRDKHKV